MKRMSRRTGWSLLAIAQMCLLGCEGRSLNARTNYDPPSNSPTAPAGVAAGSGPATEAEIKRAQVEAEIQANNELEAAQIKAFTDQGWALVEGVPPPDEKLEAYDPALLGSNETELRTQIASTTAKASDVPALLTIARTTTNLDIQTSAVEALGRVRHPDAQRALLALVSNPIATDTATRSLIVSLIVPEDLSDEFANGLIALLNSSTASSVEKTQAAMNLAMLSLRDNQPLPAMSAGAAAAVLDAQKILGAK